MLRLVELESGSITIDGQDLSTLPREVIRSRIITIPQDSFVLDDSIRLNMDPTGRASDDHIVAALQRVKLWDLGHSGQNLALLEDRYSGVADPGDLEVLHGDRGTLITGGVGMEVWQVNGQDHEQ